MAKVSRDELDRKEKRIIDEQKRIERAEKLIERAEARIIRSEDNIFQKLKKGPNGTIHIKNVDSSEVSYLRALIVGRLARRYRMLFTLVVTAGVVLVWRGIWNLLDVTPIMSSPVVSLLVGIFVLWVVQRYTEL